MGERILVCEGYATGASLHAATGHYVAAAMNAGNLKPVALALRSKYPAAHISIMADNDSHLDPNIGLVKAHEAAAAIGARKPSAPPCAGDWNDYLTGAPHDKKGLFTL